MYHPPSVNLPRDRQHGRTLIELIVMISIIIVFAVVVTSTTVVILRREVTRLHCRINLRTIGIAYRAYIEDHHLESSPPIYDGADAAVPVLLDSTVLAKDHLFCPSDRDAGNSASTKWKVPHGSTRTSSAHALAEPGQADRHDSQRGFPDEARDSRHPALTHQPGSA